MERELKIIGIIFQDDGEPVYTWSPNLDKTYQQNFNTEGEWTWNGSV